MPRGGAKRRRLAPSRVNDTRVSVVHRGALETNSWMELRCLNDDGSVADSTSIRVNPFVCTHRSMDESSAAVELSGEDHGHDFVRHWEVDQMPGKELLEACADVYGLLSELVEVAHKEAGATTQSNYSGSMPCMRETLSHRTAHIDRVGDWVNEPPGLHES